MDPAALRGFCLALPGAVEEFPFGEDVSVFKVGGKMFALAHLAGDPLRVSLKCEPQLGESLRTSYDAIVPGYHVNKRHWLTITVDADADDTLVEGLLEDSYTLVAPRRR